MRYERISSRVVNNTCEVQEKIIFFIVSPKTFHIVTMKNVKRVAISPVLGSKR